MSWETVAEGIAQARRELGVRQRRDVPQEEIASAVGVTVAAYSRWEKGERVPSEDYVRKLAVFFGVTPAWLRYGLGEGPLEERRPVLPDPTVDILEPEADVNEAVEEVAARTRRSRRPSGGDRPKRP